MPNRISAGMPYIAAATVLTAWLMAGCAGTMPRGTQAASQGTQAATQPEQSTTSQANDYFLAGKMAEAKEDWGTAASSYLEALQYDPGSDEIAIAVSKAFLHDNKLKSALYYAQVAVKLNPKVPEYWQIVQYLQERAGNFSEAANALKHYIALTPESGFVQDLRLSQYYFALGKNKEARNLLLDRAKNSRTPAEEIFEIARALAFNDMEDDAVKVLQNQINRDPLDVQSWLALGELYMNANQNEKALSTFQEALNKNPGNIFLIVTIGNQCLIDNDWKNAANYFEQAAKAGTDKIESAGLSYLDVIKTLTAVYFYAGRDSDAGDLLDMLKKQEDDDASLYFSLGKTMNYLKRYDESIGYYRAGMMRDLKDIDEEDMVRAFSGYAGALINAKQGDEALRLIQEDAVTLIKDSATLKSMEASIYIELKRYTDATALYEWLSASDPENRGYQFSLSLAYDLDGRFKDSEGILLKIIDQNPDDALALNNLAYMYLERDMNISQSLKMVQHALIAEPNNGAYLDTLAWAYYKEGKYRDARKQVERALKWSEPEDAGVIYEHYGDILVKANQMQDARNAYQKALDSGEDPGRIQPKIDKLPR